jgi:hypothetical protein
MRNGHTKGLVVSSTKKFEQITYDILRSFFLADRDPAKVALAYAIDSRWRNRSEFINGRNEIIAFLSRKWVFGSRKPAPDAGLLSTMVSENAIFRDTCSANRTAENGLLSSEAGHRHGFSLRRTLIKPGKATTRPESSASCAMGCVGYNLRAREISKSKRVSYGIRSVIHRFHIIGFWAEYSLH